MQYKPLEGLNILASGRGDAHVIVRRDNGDEYFIPLETVCVLGDRKGKVYGELLANSVIDDGRGDVLQRLFDNREIVELEIRIGALGNNRPHHVYVFKNCVLTEYKLIVDDPVKRRFRFRCIRSRLLLYWMKLLRR